MNRSHRALFGLACFVFLPPPANSAEEYWPQPMQWETVSAAQAGFEEQKLTAATDYAMQQKSLGVLVLRGGRIVVERYSDDWGPNKSRVIASATKSMQSILVGIALDEGKFQGLDQSISDFAKQWKGTPKEAITLRHLLTMTSGLNSKGFQAVRTRGDQFDVNARMPLTAKPGTLWRYNTPAYHMLFRLVEKATGTSLEDYARQKLFDPLGMRQTSWLKEPAGEVTNYYRAICSTRDMGRFGLLVLRGGRWQDRQLVSSEYFQMATTPSQKLNPAYGFLFWLNAEPATNNRGAKPALRFAGAPRDTIAAMGAGSQNIMVVPSLDLVVVRQGEAPQNRALAAVLLRRVIRAISDGS